MTCSYDFKKEPDLREELAQAFDDTTGHSHDGSDSAALASGSVGATQCGVTAGTATASKAVVLDSNKALDEVNTAKLSIGASGSETEVTATAAELNVLDESAARADGWGPSLWYSATFDATSGATVAAHGLGVSIPANMVVVGGFIDVVKTFTDGADDSATIAIHVKTANDVVTATAISGGSNIWDQGLQTIIPDRATVGDMIKTTEASEITATVADDALTDGKLIVHLECVKTDADVS